MSCQKSHQLKDLVMSFFGGGGVPPSIDAILINPPPLCQSIFVLHEDIPSSIGIPKGKGRRGTGIEAKADMERAEGASRISLSLITATMMQGEMRGKFINWHWGQTLARSSVLLSVGVPQCPQYWWLRSQVTICEACPARM